MFMGLSAIVGSPYFSEANMRLNLGCGEHPLAGWTNWDIKTGRPCYPLQVADGSVEEIRASHVLEHLTFAEASEAVADWVRALKPNGKLWIAVPDVDKCLSQTDGKRLFYLMGGQTDAHDVHKSAYDVERLEALMEQAGLTEIQPWASTDPDCSSHPVSLNRVATKPAAANQSTRKQFTVKVGAYITHPRYEAVAARNIIEGALKPLKIDLHCSQGVFWGQCMQRMFEDAVAKGIDWILSIDSDSLFTTKHIQHLCDVFAQTPDADAMAALQCRRGGKYPLMTIGKQQDTAIQVGGLPIKVTTAHFGLTLLRVKAFTDLPKPWFKSEPGPNGEWNDERLDDDIYFWHIWRQAGKTIYVAPTCRIGHLEETVAVFDENLQPKHIYVHEWRKDNGI